MAHQAAGPGSMMQRKLQIFPGNGKLRKLGAKEVGQLCYFNLRVPVDLMSRSMLTPAHDAADAVKIGSDRKQARRYFDDEIGDDATEARCIAQKLDGIAETVQATEDDAAAVEWLAVPHTMRIGSVSAPDRVGLSPRESEISGEHVRRPAATRAFITVSALGFCKIKCDVGFRISGCEQRLREFED